MDVADPRQFFLERFGLSDRALEHVLGTALERRADHAECYFEFRVNQTASLEDGVVKKATRNVSQGVGVRVLAGTRTGYAYSDEVSLERLEIAARTARFIADERAGDRGLPAPSGPRAPHDLYALSEPPIETPVPDQVALLARLDAVARAADPAITNVLAGLGTEHRVVLVVNSAGVFVGDVRPLVHLTVTCIAERGQNRQQGTYGGGGRLPFSALTDGRAERFAREAARQALTNLEAIAAPAGTMTVVLGPGWPGILLHEAVGHGLEGDFNRKRVSAFTDRIGTRVASELCTVIDDGTIPLRRGSLNIDDEGTPTGRTVLIEKGILRGYLQDRLNASLMGMPLTGNGRRESYAHVPMPRMTNTFMLAGEDAPEDIIRSVDRGLYAVSFGGGQVDITSGKFVFSASEAYVIEGGRVGRPVKGATLIGNGPDVLQRISRVGADLQLDEGIGTCGKDGQSVPVGVGLPTVRIDGLTVGGTQA
ncbi:MAG: metalloprotease TldD [Deltaproteobacteria bacterium]|nr:MAG: metalloprotease TldD [Deltaproteobacteria bacterium]